VAKPSGAATKTNSTFSKQQFRSMSEAGTNNTDYIKKQISFIERDHKRTPEVQRLLERAC